MSGLSGYGCVDRGSSWAMWLIEQREKHGRQRENTTLCVINGFHVDDADRSARPNEVTIVRSNSLRPNANPLSLTTSTHSHVQHMHLQGEGIVNKTD
jgi:hypothetical protein